MRAGRRVFSVPETTGSRPRVKRYTRRLLRKLREQKDKLRRERYGVPASSSR